MCTAATYKTKRFLFWKNTGLRIFLRRSDYDHSKELSVFFPACRYKTNALCDHRHGSCSRGYPLYYDAINEKGVGMAGLNFVGNAAYANVKPDVTNVAQFEFIPWILSQCASVAEVRTLLSHMNLWSILHSANSFLWRSFTGSSLMKLHLLQ